MFRHPAFACSVALLLPMAAGCLKRGQTNSGTRFVVAPSCVDR